MSEDTIPGSTVLTFEAFDSDLSRENCGFDFAIANGNEGNAFQIESSVRFLEGRGFQTVGTLLLAEGIDFETKPLYNLTVVVSDRGVPQKSSSVVAVITIGDVNDNPPAFSRAEYSVSLSEGAAAGTEIIRLLATGGYKTVFPFFLLILTLHSYILMMLTKYSMSFSRPRLDSQCRGQVCHQLWRRGELIHNRPVDRSLEASTSPGPRAPAHTCGHHPGHRWSGPLRLGPSCH